ncbi:hypothetical protein GSI_07155 [Ganoderma sinense ZZ0214-1]|uniref:Uncharacterized protein n=1 Tax=Ganoderma sinense ZZ0214-1 TaxID=1077348 RepID=A0A2G8S9M6_9APHY|nr:hypothetical protein GSI_07155 [Ganoderma sinense ZZ0214-1]
MPFCSPHRLLCPDEHRDTPYNNPKVCLLPSPLPFLSPKPSLRSPSNSAPKTSTVHKKSSPTILPSTRRPPSSPSLTWLSAKTKAGPPSPS